MKNETKYGKGWAWSINRGICFWAEPTLKNLLEQPKPSPEARAIKVALVPMKEYHKLRKLKKPERKPQEKQEHE